MLILITMASLVGGSSLIIINHIGEMESAEPIQEDVMPVQENMPHSGILSLTGLVVFVAVVVVIFLYVSSKRVAPQPSQQQTHAKPTKNVESCKTTHAKSVGTLPAGMKTDAPARLYVEHYDKNGGVMPSDMSDHDVPHDMPHDIEITCGRVPENVIGVQAGERYDGVTGMASSGRGKLTRTHKARKNSGCRTRGILPKDESQKQAKNQNQAKNQKQAIIAELSEWPEFNDDNAEDRLAKTICIIGETNTYENRVKAAKIIYSRMGYNISSARDGAFIISKAGQRVFVDSCRAPLADVNSIQETKSYMNCLSVDLGILLCNILHIQSQTGQDVCRRQRNIMDR